MGTLVLIFVIISTIITSIIEFIKPAYKKVAWKYAVSINVALSFILWLIASYSFAPYFWFDFNNWMLFLAWLALWTWSNIWYDLWEIVKSFWDRIKSVKTEIK